MLTTVLVGSIVTVSGLLFLGLKTSTKVVKRILGYELYIDTCLSVLLLLISFNPAVSVTLALQCSCVALLFSISLWFLKRFYRPERYDFKSREWVAV